MYSDHFWSDALFPRNWRSKTKKILRNWLEIRRNADLQPRGRLLLPIAAFSRVVDPLFAWLCDCRSAFRLISNQFRSVFLVFEHQLRGNGASDEKLSLYIFDSGRWVLSTGKKKTVIFKAVTVLEAVKVAFPCDR